MKEHEREVSTFIDFVGNVGGVHEIVMMTISAIVGSYLRFATHVKWFKKLVTFKLNADGYKDIFHTNGAFRTKKLNMIIVYLKHYSFLSCFIKCCCFSDKDKVV